MENQNTQRTDRLEVVVSLTSFPPAISYAVKAIQSILQGDVLPDHLVLYLTLSEFQGQPLPAELLSLAEQNPIFEIRNYDSNIRSYRKLIPALIDFPEATIVTIDDDVYYDCHMLRDLLRWNAVYPHAILAHRAKRIQPGRPYREWKKYRWYHFLFKKINLGFCNLPTGVAGVLYPPHALKKEMLNPDLFFQIAPTTDDIWFWAAATAKGTPVLPIPFGHNKPKGLHKPKAISLKTENFKGATDKNAAALQAILEHFPEISKSL